MRCSGGDAGGRPRCRGVRCGKPRSGGNVEHLVCLAAMAAEADEVVEDVEEDVDRRVNGAPRRRAAAVGEPDTGRVQRLCTVRALPPLRPRLLEQGATTRSSARNNINSKGRL
ncbi:hypothetical protein VaNZ11_010271 [Volvox africanus]|uniref:Uncharacterized protein n=1 Tax=Volvox africanus TaxID=51714 RepID=A0ABQ5S959_9CHLO|nr:hypothetical protein VaNZ11_010271 [Volvox africanus]